MNYTALTNELTKSQQAAFADFLETHPAPRFKFELLEGGARMDVLTDDNTRAPQMWYSSRSLPGDTTFPSPEGQDVRVVYSRKSDIVRQNGIDVREAVPERVQFEGGAYPAMIEVPRTASVLLIRMLFSDECANGLNPARREPLTGYVYQLIQPEKTAAERAAYRSRIVRTQGLIDANTDAENLLIARRLETGLRLSFDFGAGPDSLRSALFDAAQNHPDAVHRASTDAVLKAEALVAQAVSAKVLRFVPETREWRYEATGQKLQIIPTGDPTEGLAAWLLDDQGAVAFAALKKELETEEKPAKTPRGVPFTKKS